MPVDPKLFNSGMERLARRLTDPRIDRITDPGAREKAVAERTVDYAALVADVLSSGEWLDAVTNALRTCKFFPTPAELLAHSEGTRRARVDEDANLAFELVTGATVHRLEHEEFPTGRPRARSCNCVGDVYDVRLIAERLGAAAAHAFVQAGGAPAFEGMDLRDLPFVRKRYVEAYRGRVEGRSREALPEPLRKAALVAPRAPQALPAGDEERILTPEEAKKFLDQIRTSLSEYAVMEPEEHAARVAELQEQARQIQEAPDAVR